MLKKRTFLICSTLILCPYCSHRVSSGVLWEGLHTDVPVSKWSGLWPHIWAVYLSHRVHGDALWTEWVWALTLLNRNPSPPRTKFHRCLKALWEKWQLQTDILFELLVGSLTKLAPDFASQYPGLLGIFADCLLPQMSSEKLLNDLGWGLWLQGWRQNSNVPSVHPGSFFLTLFLEQSLEELSKNLLSRLFHSRQCLCHSGGKGIPWGPLGCGGTKELGSRANNFTKEGASPCKQHPFDNFV